MRTTVINNFIDNKIRNAISEKKDMIEDLRERMNKVSDKSTMRVRFKDYMTEFTEKRIADITLFKEKFSDMPDNKLLSLIRLKDKLCGLEDKEIV